MEEAVGSLLNAFKRYLEVQGRRILSILEITGQDKIRIEVRALYRFFEPTENFSKLSDVLGEIEKKNLWKELEKVGIYLVSEDDTTFLEVSSEFLKELLG